MRSLKKRITALTCAVMMTVSSLSVSAPVTVEAKRVENLDVLSRQAAADGCVLLKNENNALPIAKNTKVSVFGRGQNEFIACGKGSGGGVKTEYRIDILKGLEDSKYYDINNNLKKEYQNFAKNNGGSEDEFANKNNRCHSSKVEKDWSEDDVKKYKRSDDEVAIILISRNAGEDSDLSFNKGSLLLTDKEDKMLKNVSNVYDKVVVILNTTGIIDMSWAEKYPKIDSIMYAWTGGQECGNGVADVVTGKVNPSGKLTDTIAKNVKDYPTYENYGEKELYYQEDIYVGYRYFETFAQDKVAYPFGYGLSYTTFKTEFQRAEEEDGYIKVVASVTNTGKVAGKEVVQVYYGAPQGGLGNPAKELVAFAKTKELQPGETETMSLNFKISDMASYDDGGMYKESAYVLEAGDYKIYLGNSVRSSELVYTYNQKEVKVVEQLSEALAPIRDFNRFKAEEENGKYTLKEEKVPKLHTNIEERLNNNLPKEFKAKSNSGDKLYSLLDVYEGDLTMEEFVAQMTPEQMGMLAQGSQDVKDSYTSGGASQFGGVRCKDKNGKLTYLSELYGIPVAMTADGPSGINISDKCTMIPCGNVLGCTWDLQLIEDMYELLGKELVENDVDSLLGPGVNIKRDPRCGRNFEYFSEDPLLAGRMAAVMTKAVQEQGSTLTIKHFACNNCECNVENLKSIRGTADAIISERALREIYLKVFEIAVKEGGNRSIMTAYNPINGCWAASNYDLNTTILRNEWGFDGLVMTDWWANMSYKPWATGTSDNDMKFSPDQRGTMLKAQNDIWMTLDNKVSYNDQGKEQNRNKVSQILKDYENGYLKLSEMQRSAYNICNFLIRSEAFARKHKLDFNKVIEKYKVNLDGKEWFKVEQAEVGNPQISKVTVGGRALTTFNSNVKQYKVFLPADATEIPEIKVTTGEGTTVKVEQATKDNRTAVINATESNATVKYSIVFADEDGIKPILENPVSASLTDIKVGGKSVDGFNAQNYAYSVAVDSLDKEPEVTWTAPEGITVKKAYDATAKTVTLRAMSADQAVSYKLNVGVAPQSDEFNDAELSKVWTVDSENETNWKIEDGHLVIGAEYGSIWQDQDHLNPNP